MDEEWLARFVIYSKWIRSSDQSIRPDAFIPPQNLQLSVTRHLGLSEAEIWQLGQAVADKRPARPYGRADLQAAEARRHSLHIEPEPIENNPNHAHITNWPADKPTQKIISLELSASAKFVPH